MDSPNYLKEVREHYEDYPYPERNPDDEITRLLPTVTDSLDRVNYYCFEGKEDFENNFRVLIAGGGTGDSTIFLAEQLRNTNAEIVHLDITLASMDIAKKRAEVRGLKNIIWLNESLLNLPSLGLEGFDYINCSGVLHHLEDPNEGLTALNAVLKDDGAMSIMVYATYGRTSIYQIQELMRIINADERDMHIKVENCKSILADLPATHLLTHSKRLFPDWDFKKPIELYDLFLHSQDRAYTIPELYNFVEAEGLSILHLLPAGDAKGIKLYDPSSYTTDEKILDRIKNYPLKDKQGIAELMHGLIPKHTFYAVRKYKKPPSLDNLANVPYFDIGSNKESYASFLSVVIDSVGTVALKKQNTKYRTSFKKNEYSEAIFKYLDGNRSLDEIFKKIIASPKYKKCRPTIPRLQSSFKDVFEALALHDWIFLRDQSVKHPVTITEMQSRITSV